MQELDSSQNDTEFQWKSPNWAGGDSLEVRNQPFTHQLVGFLRVHVLAHVPLRPVTSHPGLRRMSGNIGYMRMSSAAW